MEIREPRYPRIGWRDCKPRRCRAGRSLSMVVVVAIVRPIARLFGRCDYDQARWGDCVLISAFPSGDSWRGEYRKLLRSSGEEARFFPRGGAIFVQREEIYTLIRFMCVRIYIGLYRMLHFSLPSPSRFIARCAGGEWNTQIAILAILLNSVGRFPSVPLALITPRAPPR